MNITTDPGNITTVECERPFTVQLAPVDGEAGRFTALSPSRYICQTCRVEFSAKAPAPCKRCGSEAARVTYSVDCEARRCTCKSYACGGRGEICKHLAAALVVFALRKVTK